MVFCYVSTQKFLDPECLNCSPISYYGILENIVEPKRKELILSYLIPLLISYVKKNVQGVGFEPFPSPEMSHGSLLSS